MSTFQSGAAPFDDTGDEAPEEVTMPAADKTPGGKQEVRWEVVAKTAGLTPAIVIAGRLQAEGIQARAWQEGAGQAIGLSVGLLGTGYVTVPEFLVEKAKAILAEPYDEEE
jgi:hypothetical protein